MRVSRPLSVAAGHLQLSGHAISPGFSGNWKEMLVSTLGMLATLAS